MTTSAIWRRRALILAAPAFLVLGLIQPPASAAPASKTADVGFAYTGTWSPTANTGRQSWHTGSTATAAIQVGSGGGSINVRATTGPSMGKAGVSLDGGTTATVDSYRSSWGMFDLYQSAALPAGCHTVKVSVLGQKASASSGTTVAVHQVSTTNGTILAPGSTCSTTPPPPVVAPEVTVSSRDVTATTAVLDWDYTAGSSSSAVDSIRAGRTGTDSTGYGPWSTTKPVADGSQEFTELVAGQTYTLYVELLKNGSVVKRAETQVTPGGAQEPPPVTEPAVTVTSSGVTASTATLNWDYTVGSDPAAVDSIRAGRNGTDSTGYGPWSTLKPVADGSQEFTELVAGQTYTLYVELLKSGSVVKRAETQVTPTGSQEPPPPNPVCSDGLDNDGDGKVDHPADPGCTSPTDPDETDPASPPPGGDASTAYLAGLQLPARGLFSGASGEANDITAGRGAFGTWRDDPTDATANWTWTPDFTSGLTYGVMGPNDGPVRDFKGLLDLSIGGPSNWGPAAAGEYDDEVRAMLQRLRANRTIDGVLYPTVLRPAHEMNGNWYQWSVSYSEIADFKAAVTRWEAISDTAYPEVMWSLGLNGESSGGMPSAAELWIDGVFDVIGVDRYNQYPYIGTANNGSFVSWEDGINRGTVDRPIGIEKWRQFAISKGVPLMLPEYGNNAVDSVQGGDDPYWVNRMIPYIDQHAGKGPGQFLAEIWYNLVNIEENRWHLYDRDNNPPTRQPNTAAAYDALFPRP